MTAWATHRRFGIAAAALFLLFTGAPLFGAAPAPAPPLPTSPQFPVGSAFATEALADPLDSAKPAPAAKPTPAQLRAQAEAAERAGDWEAAFAAYCQLYLADRSAPDVRDRLNAALRRVQQYRRHRDHAFVQFASGLPAADAVNLFAEVVTKVPVMFPDPARAAPQQLWANGIEELDRALGDPAFRTAFLDNPSPGKVEAFRVMLRSSWAKRPVTSSRTAKATLQSLILAAQGEFHVRVPAALAVEVVCGACSGLDEYTVFLSPGVVNPEAVDPGPDLSAYGIYLAFQDGVLVVDGVAVGSWAAFHTPLHKGDRVARINGRTMAGPGAATDALRVPRDGFHELELFPMGPDMPPVVVALPLAVPSVFGERMVKDGVGYVRISHFQPSTAAELDAAVAKLRAEGLRSLILDLRGNHGGSFLSGVEVCRRLLPAGLIVTTQGQLPQVDNQVFTSESGMNALDVPLVVLIDTETASAAEVVAAALKDNNRAVLVGMPSFGKGTIQYPLKLTAADEADGMGRPQPRSGTVRVTIARLVAPHGGAINGVGVTPQVIVADPARQWDAAVRRAADLLPRSPTPSMQQ